MTKGERVAALGILAVLVAVAAGLWESNERRRRKETLSAQTELVAMKAELKRLESRLANAEQINRLCDEEDAERARIIAELEAAKPDDEVPPIGALPPNATVEEKAKHAGRAAARIAKDAARDITAEAKRAALLKRELDTGGRRVDVEKTKAEIERLKSRIAEYD